MRQGKVFWSILKRTHADRIVTMFFLYFLVCGAFIMIVEPGIDNSGDAIWYCFSVITSIGFGDFTAVTTLGRVATIVLGLYGVIVLAIIPGIVASYYMEIVNVRNKESGEMFLHKLEHLDELSREELKELSEKVKNRKFKI